MSDDEQVSNQSEEETSSSEEEFDRERFLDLRCQRHYNFLQEKPILKECALNLINVPEKLPQIYARLQQMRWDCFARSPGKYYPEWVYEFYANARKTDFNGELVTTVRGRQIRFDAATLNEYYGLPEVDNDIIKAKYEQGGPRWLEQKLAGDKRTTWGLDGKHPKSSDFLQEARIWLHIVNRTLMPCTNFSDCKTAKGPIIAGLVDGCSVDVGKVMIEQIKIIATTKRARSIFYPSLITQLCLRAGLPPPPAAEMRSPGSLIDIINIKGTDFEPKKKRKINSGSTVDVNDPSFGMFSDAGCSTSSGVPPTIPSGPPFALQLSSQISGFEGRLETRLRELVSQLPQVPPESTTASGALPAVTLQTLADDHARLAEQFRRHRRHQKKFGKRSSRFLNGLKDMLTVVCGKKGPDDLKYPHSEEDTASTSPGSS